MDILTMHIPTGAIILIIYTLVSVLAMILYNVEMGYDDSVTRRLIYGHWNTEFRMFLLNMCISLPFLNIISLIPVVYLLFMKLINPQEPQDAKTNKLYKPVRRPR